MKPKNYLIINFIFLLSLLNSCITPNPVIRVTPKESTTTWDQGKEFVSYQKNDFIIHCAFHGVYSSYIVFDVEIINEGQEEFLVLPEKFLIFPDSGKWDPLSNQYIYASFPSYAEDPEKQLLKLDIKESEVKSDIKFQEARNNTPTVTVSSNGDNNSSVTYVNEADASLANNYNKLQRINSKKETWSQNALRKTTLSAEESVRGLIYFPKPDFELYKNLKIEVPILNDKIFFNYSVQLYYPGKNQPQ